MTAQFTSSGMIFHHVCSCHVVAHQTLFYLWHSTCTWKKHCLSCWLCFCSCCYLAAEFVDWDSFTSFSCHLLSFLSCLHIGRIMVLLTKSLSLTLPLTYLEIRCWCENLLAQRGRERSHLALSFDIISERGLSPMPF